MTYKKRYLKDLRARLDELYASLERYLSKSKNPDKTQLDAIKETSEKIKKAIGS